MINSFFRCSYRLLYLVARVYWWLCRPRTHAAIAAIWHADKLLLVKPSYRSQMTLPGGFVRRGEQPYDAVVREIAEELGLVLPAGSLHLFGETDIRSENRMSVETVFHAHLETEPAISVDHREITSAQFYTISDARRLEITRITRWYLDHVGSP